MTAILGISAFYHDSAAALVVDGDIVAAAQEERFTRKKHDPGFPAHAIAYCLKEAGMSAGRLSYIAFYDKPLTKFERLLETYLAYAPAGFKSFRLAMPLWLKDKLHMRRTLRQRFHLARKTPLVFTDHHESHAASAFFPSPFDAAAILTVDGVGEWSTATLGVGEGNQLRLLQQLQFPHSLGLLYSAFTAYCGFRINSGEYKLMGLAPYGEPKYSGAIYEQLMDLKPDGSFRLNLDYFDFLRGARMTNEKFHRLFGGPARLPGAPIEARHMDVARSIQAVTEEVMLRLARHAREITGQKNLCLAGGVALNCVANGVILREKLFERIWIQPAAGDAGGALGAALALWHGRAGQRGTQRLVGGGDKMQGAFLGPQFSTVEIQAALDANKAVYQTFADAELIARTVELLQRGKVVGWFQGRMEFGPRALGNRSILGDARSPSMQSTINLKVKFRESFRPFAPVVRLERASDYFELDVESPYMLLVAPVKKALCLPSSGLRTGLDRLKEPRSTLPAVTHVDFSARVQTVTHDQNPLLNALLEQFEQASGCGVLVNTSFNVRGEPVVCTPDDAYRCFLRTGMDYLIIGNFVLERAAQPRAAAPQNHAPGPD